MLHVERGGVIYTASRQDKATPLLELLERRGRFLAHLISLEHILQYLEKSTSCAGFLVPLGAARLSDISIARKKALTRSLLLRSRLVKVEHPRSQPGPLRKRRKGGAMVNFSTLSASMSPRSAGTTENSGTTASSRSSVGADEKANAKQREEAVHSMSSEGNPFALDDKDNKKDSESKASPVVENPFDLDGTKKEQGPANNTKSGVQAQTVTAVNDDIEEVFMVDVPAVEEVEPPSWMMGSSSVGGDVSKSDRTASSPPPGKAFNYFHQEQHHDRPSESSLSAAAAAGEVSSEKQSSEKKKRKKKKSVSSSRSKSGAASDDQTLLTLASSASTANPDGSRKGTHHRDDYEVMLEAMDRTMSGGAAHHRHRPSHADGDSSSVVSASSHTSGRSSVTSRSSRRRRGKLSSDHTVLPVPSASSDSGDLLNLHGSFSSASSPKVVLTSSHDEQDGDSDDSAYEHFAGGIISSDNTATAQSIMDMSSRGEVLSDVQIHHPQAQIEDVDAPDAAAGGAAAHVAAGAVDILTMESFGQGGRKSSKAGKALANFVDGPDVRKGDGFAGIDGLEAPSQGDVEEAAKSRGKSSGKDHKHSKRHRYTRSRGDRRKKGEDYNGLALDEETASIAEKLHFGWGRNEMDTGGGATDVPSPEMVSKVGLAPPSAHSQDTTSRSSSIASSSAAIEAIKKLGKSVARRVSAPDARYLQIDVTNGKAVVEQSKSTSQSRVGSISSRSNEDMEAAAANFLFDDHEIKDYDTAQAELSAKKKQRARLSKSQWGDGTRRASYDGFNDEIDIHEEGYSDDGAPRRKSAARVGPITSWAFLAERYAPSTNFSDKKKKRRRLDDDGIIDDEDLNDNRDAPLPQGHGDLDVMGWTTPFFDRKKRRQRIFWATTGIIIGLAFLIGGIMIANGRKQAQDGTVSDSSVGTGAPGGTGERPGEDGTPVFNGPTDSGWQETPEGNLDDKPRDPAPLRPSLPPPPVETPRPLETPESNTGDTHGPGTLGGKHALSDSDVKKILAQVTPESILLDPTSPQYGAMEWLLDDIDTSLIYFAGSDPSERIIQRYTLAVIYHATGGPWGAWETDELWLTEEDECEWFGVRCGTNGETEEVVMQQPEGAVRLRRRSAELNSPQDIVQSQVLWDENTMLSGGSSFATYLDLSSNGLQGVIPEEIFTLWKLEQLLLFDNKIGKTIPWDSLTKLQSLHTLYLDRNKLTGNIPNTIGQLSNLKNLDLSDNKLSSTLPNALGNLVNLVDLRLSDNDFTGEFPFEIADLTGLATLLASGNSIGGTLPAQVGTQLTNLIVVRLHDNELFGSLPYFASPKLEELHLDDNAFDSEIVMPKSTLLRELYLGKNLLRGTIPSNIATLAPRLELLDLSFNELSGDIPTASLSQLTKAKDIRLNDNSDLRGDVDGVCDALPGIGANMRVDLSLVTCKCCNCC